MSVLIGHASIAEGGGVYGQPGDQTGREVCTRSWWAGGWDYLAVHPDPAVRERHEDKLYRCVQGHTSQMGWEPPNVPALWTEVAKPGEIPVWRQPTGAQDAYNKGERVWYPDKDTTVYESLIDGNVWEPGVYGWEEVV